jgi:hypothetical protein
MGSRRLDRFQLVWTSRNGRPQHHGLCWVEEDAQRQRKKALGCVDGELLGAGTWQLRRRRGDTG